MLTIAEMAETTLPIFVLRVLSPAVVFTAATTLLGLKQQPQPPTQSAITSVVVATPVPRRAAILALLSLTALTYLGDGLVFVVYSVISKHWPRHTAIPLNAVLGLASFSGIAAIGAWKDVAGASVWSLRRVKLAIFTSLALDIALLALLGLEIHLQLYRMSFCPVLAPLTDICTQHRTSRKIPSHCRIYFTCSSLLFECSCLSRCSAFCFHHAQSIPPCRLPMTMFTSHSQPHRLSSFRLKPETNLRRRCLASTRKAQSTARSAALVAPQTRNLFPKRARRRLYLRMHLRSVVYRLGPCGPN